MTAPYLPAPTNPPDPNFREIIEGGHALILECTPGHALVLEYGDCEFWASCQCGKRDPYPSRPNQSQATSVASVVVRHGEADIPLLVTLYPHCQCGADLGQPFTAVDDAGLDAAMGAWERHSMGVGR